MPLLFWGRQTRNSAAVPGAKTDGNLFFLSNFYHAPIVWHGKRYATSEHLYQARKFLGVDDEHAERIRCARTPTHCKALSRQRGHPIRPGWDEERVGVMREVVALKFDQHPTLMQKLLSTGSEELWEDARGDRFWGAGTPAQRGENWLGRILMDLRAEHRTDE